MLAAYVRPVISNIVIAGKGDPRNLQTIHLRFGERQVFRRGNSVERHVPGAYDEVGFGVINPPYNEVPVKEEEGSFPRQMRVGNLDHVEISHVRTFACVYDMVNTDHHEFIAAVLPGTL